MTKQYATSVRNAALDAIETAIGTTPVLKLRSGAAPANADAADTGTVLCTITLPSDWMAPASGGVKALLGSWAGTASAAGTVGHYRVYKADGTTIQEQGSVTATGGGGDMTLDNPVLAVGQSVTITSFTDTFAA